MAKNPVGGDDQNGCGGHHQHQWYISIGTATPENADAIETSIHGPSGAQWHEGEAAIGIRKSSTVRIAYGTQGDIAQKRVGAAGTPLFGSAGLRRNW